MAEYDYEFDIAMLEPNEVKLLTTTPPKECWICESIISKALVRTHEGDYWISVDDLDDSNIEHLDQIINRKLSDGIVDMVMVNGRYTSNQF